MNILDIPAIFKSDAEELIKARNDSKRIHGAANIRAAGNEVEQPVRNYFRRMLPSKYYVTQGQIIDAVGKVSPQIDIIIADNLRGCFKSRSRSNFMPIFSP
jgi:hypothetical protein